ncbi:hypothetical protein [Streptomyces sp. CBMA156]|uniref:hypothetical protein n=1 Tax=Streptomyces sp. CBMA156 TaxID=1930280 RepID=UPI001661DE40|nr:hypothetical protein [Streptomyces sp. CBMA156]MBD0675462.1 hypothetical protein [Streptomyces sp. CBMA156]
MTGEHRASPAPVLTDPGGLFAALRTLALPTGHWVVCGSAPLYARGLRPALRDLDVLARGPAWHRALLLAPPAPAASGHGLVVRHPAAAIDVFDAWPHLDPAAAIDHADLIDGIPLLRLGDTVAWKTTVGRPQDLADVAAVHRLYGRWSARPLIHLIHRTDRPEEP